MRHREQGGQRAAGSAPPGVGQIISSGTSGADILSRPHSASPLFINTYFILFHINRNIFINTFLNICTFF